MLTNAFSLNMLKVTAPVSLVVAPATIEDAKAALASGGSAIGHADTAMVVGGILGVAVPCNRATVALKAGDSIVVAQYVGPRLPEGATMLPEGSRIDFVRVTVG